MVRINIQTNLDKVEIHEIAHVCKDFDIDKTFRAVNGDKVTSNLTCTQGDHLYLSTDSNTFIRQGDNDFHVFR